MPRKILTTEILTAAIGGFESQKQKIDFQITELRQMLSGGSTESAVITEPTPGRRKMSAATRRRMAEGQKKRWAAIKGEGEKRSAIPEATRPERKLSAAGRKRIIAATKGRWARIHAEEAARKTAPGRAASKTTVAKRKVLKAA